MFKDALRFLVGGDGGIAVCRESFGLLGAGGFVGGIMDSMAFATCFRSLMGWGEDSRCAAGMEMLLEGRFGWVGLEKGMDKINMTTVALRSWT